MSSLVRLSASLEEFEVVEMPLVALRRTYPGTVHVVQSTVQRLDPKMRRITLTCTVVTMILCFVVILFYFAMFFCPFFF